MKIGYCLTGSFCTFDKTIKVIEKLVNDGHIVTPIMSENAYNINTRFGKAVDIQNKIIEITGNSIIHTIEQAEPIGPKKMFDVLAVVPCTGNTLAKLSNGIVDTTVTMAVKLGGAAKNIGTLLNYKNYYFVPFGMDNFKKKPKSMVCDFDKVCDTITNAEKGIEILKKIYWLFFTNYIY